MQQLSAYHADTDTRYKLMNSCLTNDDDIPIIGTVNAELLVTRKRAKLTQDALAAKAGLDRADIGRAEGGWIPPYDVQEAIARALGVAVEAVFVPAHKVSA